MTAPDVVILGAGIMGASVAWHLARRGVHEVLLVDRADGPGQGNTGHFPPPSPTDTTYTTRHPPTNTNQKPKNNQKTTNNTNKTTHPRKKPKQ